MLGPGARCSPPWPSPLPTTSSITPLGPGPAWTRSLVFDIDPDRRLGCPPAAPSRARRGGGTRRRSWGKRNDRRLARGAGADPRAIPPSSSPTGSQPRAAMSTRAAVPSSCHSDETAGAAQPSSSARERRSQRSFTIPRSPTTASSCGRSALPRASHSRTLGCRPTSALGSPSCQASRARLVEATESERRRIERDLHDGTQQRLVSIAMSLGLLELKLGGPTAAQPVVHERRARRSPSRSKSCAN